MNNEIMQLLVSGVNTMQNNNTNAGVPQETPKILGVKVDTALTIGVGVALCVKGLDSLFDDMEKNGLI
ncbi:hypothetical protein HPS57_10215 [Prevotella sp. PINT]|jgi:hypothetical protein|uniref:hypothetical protein n=1 Tax=Palleniella intestinalis TaxID=2736291 RepID=UPI0015559694|nr:hypothetical protein [Palleniella intestinalis]NPD82341.1 hypothetical protein [Palleniella intestinalis]